MPKTYIKPTPGFVLKRYLLVFVPLALALSAMVYGTYEIEIRQVRKSLSESQRQHLESARDGLGTVFDDVVSDLLFLAGMDEVRSWAEANTAEARSAVVLEFTGFARLKRRYHRIRIVDPAGRETVRVAGSAKASAVVPVGSQGSRSQQDLVDDALSLRQGEIHVSSWNVAVGTGPVGRSGKQVIRFATPLHRDGGVSGVLALDYLGDALAEDLWRDFHFFHGEVHLFEEGRQLMGMAMAEGGERTGFQPRGDDWLGRMAHCDNGAFELDGGLFSFVTIRPWEQLEHAAGVTVNSSVPGPHWKLVSFIPRDELNAASAAFLSKLLPLYAAGLVVLAASSFLLVRTWARLRLERDYSGQLIERSPAMIVGWDGAGRTLFVNEAVERITGYPSGELVGRNWWEVFGEAPDGEDASESFRELRQRPLQDHEMPLAARTGEKRFIVWNTVVRYDEQGRVKELVGFGNDVTERRRAEHMRAEVVAMVSHELRTPLTSVRGALGLLSAGEERLASRGRELLRIARNNTDQLVHLVDDILDVQRIESGKMDFSIRCMDLAPLLERALEANRTYADQLGVTVEWKRCCEGARISTDDRRFGQIMNNLLSNAAKFAPPEEPVRIHVEPVGKSIRIAVSDCGPGIPDHYRPHVFDKFSQADTSNTRRRGTGLGLYISKRLVEGMNGTIGFETETGIGTVFYFDLPACD